MSASSQTEAGRFPAGDPFRAVISTRWRKEKYDVHRDWIRGLFARRFLAIADPRLRVCGIVTIAALMLACFTLAPFARAATSSEQSKSRQPNFGPNVYIFDPSMPLSQIQSTVDSIATQQVSNQFGTQRYALLFEPGTYGSSANPLIFQVGYYTSVAGLRGSRATSRLTERSMYSTNAQAPARVRAALR